MILVSLQARPARHVIWMKINPDEQDNHSQRDCDGPKDPKLRRNYEAAISAGRAEVEKLAAEDRLYIVSSKFWYLRLFHTYGNCGNRKEDQCRQSNCVHGAAFRKDGPGILLRDEVEALYDELAMALVHRSRATHQVDDILHPLFHADGSQID